MQTRAHFDAMTSDEAVYPGGNGPDWKAWAVAIKRQKALTLLTENEIAQGLIG